ncbi:MAG: hypothetical protein V4574_14090 [Pseudomonadota bacterium]
MVAQGITPIEASAPTSDTATAYDRAHLLTYARMLDAADSGVDWREAAAAILGCDVSGHAAGAEMCWNSHLERARRVVGEGFVQMRRLDPDRGI